MFDYTDAQLVQALSQAREVEVCFLNLYLADDSKERDYITSMEASQILEDEANKRLLL